MGAETSSSAGEPSELDSTPIDVFISYRRDDAAGQAIALRKELAQRFGPDHVFMDVADLRPSVNFVEVIRERVARCDILIALIGRGWSPAMAERTKRRVLDHEEDYVKVELETALQRGSRVRVLPVLLDDTNMPGPNTLPRPLRRLSELAAGTLRHSRWDDDVRALIDRIDEISQETKIEAEAKIEAEVRIEADTGIEADAGVVTAEAPDQKHYADVARHIGRDNAVIPFLGSVVDADERGDDAASYGDSDELAVHLAREFGYLTDPADLAEISQRVLLTEGKAVLYKALRQIVKCSPSSVHRFFAALPADLEAWGYEHCYQLIVTTNYDDALERAFDEAQEPYDLAVYMAHGEHKERFLHLPFDGEPQPIMVPNTYLDFPIDEYGDLERTIILKVHGAVDNVNDRYPLRENYVITENDYIDYLSRSPIESLVPLQLLNKMRESHFLFLGYRVRDWNLRVFLQRVWGEQRLGARSWAIASHAEDVEKRFWNQFGVDLFDVPLTTYLPKLREKLAARERDGAP